MITITQKLLNSARTRSGNYSQKQAYLAKQITQAKSPVKSLLNHSVTEEWWACFLLARKEPTVETLTATLVADTFSRSDCEFCPTCGREKEPTRIDGKLKIRSAS